MVHSLLAAGAHIEAPGSTPLRGLGTPTGTYRTGGYWPCGIWSKSSTSTWTRGTITGITQFDHAAARGDGEMIAFLVAHGADVTALSRRGQTTADTANGPVQRIQPFPSTVALLENLGAKNNHNCVSC